MGTNWVNTDDEWCDDWENEEDEWILPRNSISSLTALRLDADPTSDGLPDAWLGNDATSSCGLESLLLEPDFDENSSIFKQRDSALDIQFDPGPHSANYEAPRFSLRIYFDDVIQLILTEMGRTVGISSTMWNLYFSLKSEALALTRQYYSCLIHCLASDTFSCETKKSPCTSSILLRNIAVKLVAFYHLGYRSQAEAFRRTLLSLPYEDVSKRLSSRLLKTVKDTLDVLDLVPSLLATCLPSQRCSPKTRGPSVLMPYSRPHVGRKRQRKKNVSRLTEEAE